MQPYNIQMLYEAFSAITKDMVLYLPRSSDLRQLAKLVKDEDKATAIHYCMNGATKVWQLFP